MIRGKGNRLEIVFAARPFSDSLAELRERLAAVPDFYSGTEASVVCEGSPQPHESALLAEILAQAGIGWDGTWRERSNVAPLPVRDRAIRDVELSDGARSLVADFAGAREDLAKRRRTPRQRFRPEPSTNGHHPAPVAAPPLVPEPAGPSVLYHRGTLRGGQSLANVGHIVLVGDVNPGAELVAGGDIVVFGCLRGVAHAGAQGDGAARVYALTLAPTQLRIATTIAAGFEPSAHATAQEAYIDASGEIAVAPAGRPPLTPREQTS